ncbi:VP35L-like protein [Mya arenaria]|uniref:VP35L-like protein n=1 Tax=Mya arenaria TaxID=6604 RepID=A0ABY7DJ91_MYAAR|nr:VP35L-like protein [Mya arenaria]
MKMNCLRMDSNDTLYGLDPKYLSELQGIFGTLVEEILTHLKTLTTPETTKRQTILSLELFQTVIGHGDLGHEKLFNLAVKLWGPHGRPKNCQ